MTDDSEAASERGQLRQEAATWFARMRGPDADDHRSAFEQWLARGAVHRSTYNRIAEVFAAGKMLKETSQRVARPRVSGALVVAVLAATIGMTVLIDPGGPGKRLVPRFGAEAAPVRIVSGAGSQRRVRLMDASLVTLDHDTLLLARYDRSARLLRLVRGRARFDVSHDSRPFTVLAGASRIVAHGTIFDVALGEEGGVEVALLRGEVEVTTRVDSTPRTRNTRVTLKPGQRLVTRPGDAATRPVAIATEPDWPGQPVIFDRAPLHDVVAAANRAGGARIVIADAATSELRVSGSFRITDSARLADRLAALFNLVVDRQTPGIVMLRKAAK